MTFLTQLQFLEADAVRSHQLPDDVFLAGETKPTKSVKEKKKKASGSRSAKRQFAETGLEVRNTRLTKSPRAS